MTERPEFQDRFVESGRIAYRAGIAKKDCPLAVGSFARKLWLRGWNEAAKQEAA